MKRDAMKLTEMVQQNWKLLAAGLGLAVVGGSIYKELTKLKLEGKVVLITGGSSGLGLALAHRLIAKGARIAICSRTEARNKQAVEELEASGGEVVAFKTDVSQPKEVDKMIRKVIDKFGRLDILVNNAGIMQVGLQEDMDIKDFEEAMNSNFWAPLHVMKAVIPHFKENGGGRIVNITSVGGKLAIPYLLPYTASKHALVGLSEGMHAELKKDNIQVVTVVPFLVQTGSTENAILKGSADDQGSRHMLESASTSVLAQDVDVAARKIIKGIEYGESEVILSFMGKAATVLQGVAPGWVSLLMSAAAGYMKEPT